MIPNHLKRQLLARLVATDDYLGRYSANDGLMSFLSKIWPLRDMPSKSDSRYSNQYDSIFKHCVNNNDWSNIQLYEDELNLINGEDRYFSLFLEIVVNPETRNSKDEIDSYVNLINDHLRDTDERLFLTDYFEELPVYKLRNRRSDGNDLPRDVQSNSIPFFKGQASINEYPCFVFTEDKWNDYGYVTNMTLAYFPDKSEKLIYFENVKILKRGQNKTWNSLPDKFTQLPSDFCSLGQTENYYRLLKQTFPKSYYSILLALRDAGLFPRILEQFENEEGFKKSLIRDNHIEQLLRRIRYMISDSNTEQYKFSYNYKPPYSENRIVINFDFEHKGSIRHRVYAIIGKNGAGKTNILSTLAHELSLQNPAYLSPQKPHNSKFFTVSYSVFDRFPIPEDNISFNYVYCGIKRRDGNVMSEDEQKDIFLEAARKIAEREMLNDWYLTLKNFIAEDLLDPIFGKEEPGAQVFSFKEGEFLARRKQFSSGESMLFYILTRIVSEIRFDSLILYDEPETHLHPNAISRLINTIFDLVDRFQSFCILATHSPLVIQEIHARDIIILDREADELRVRKMSRDSFGENLSVITDEIFNNRDVNKYHLELMRKLVDDKRPFEEIIQIFQFDNLPVNVNTRLYLKALIAARDGQS
jgi:predicted ATPase